jgi:hypothetical protein
MVRLLMHAYALRRAPELAETGDFSGWEQIARYLDEMECCKDATLIADNHGLRIRLDQLCKAATAARIFAETQAAQAACTSDNLASADLREPSTGGDCPS